MPSDFRLPEEFLKRRMRGRNVLEEGHEIYGSRMWVKSATSDAKLQEAIAFLQSSLMLSS